MTEHEICALLGQNIKRFRKRYNWPQEKLAEIIGVSTNFLCNIENGKGWVSPTTLSKLLAALNIDLHELFAPSEPLPKNVFSVMERYNSEVKTSLEYVLTEAVRRSVDDVFNTYGCAGA